MKKLWLIPLLLSFLGTAMAEQRLQGWCEVGGQKVVTQGANSTTQVQVSYPSCSVTVYLTGTVTKATLHSDNSGTILANPFTANTNGSWGFYTADGRYDIVLSKTASTGFPFTISDVLFCDPTTCGGGGGGGSGTVTSVGVSASNTGLSVAGSPVTTAGTIALTSNAAGADEALRSTAANVSSYTPIPLCADTAGQHLNYDTTLHTFSCGTSGSGGTGTVTSVGMTATNTGFAVSGSPITSSGTLALTSQASAADQGLRSTAAATASFVAIPACTDIAGQHLNYDTVTHTYSCGSTGAAAAFPNFRGTWDSSITYAQNDGVLLNGSSYVAKAVNTGVTPGTDGGVTWQLIAQAGTNGTNGTNGTSGADGAPGVPGYSPNQIISGCGVNYNTGLNFTVQPCTYLIQNTQRAAPLTTVTGTAADPSLPRIDAIVADNTGTISIIAGTAASTPAPPSLDITSQLQVTFYTVDAGATVPTNVTTTDLYHENAEWTCTSSATVNCASTNNPHSGTKDIEWTAAATGNFGRLTIPAGTIDMANFDKLNIFVRSKAAWPGTRALTIQWYNGGTAKCSPVTLKDGNFTFNSSVTSAYQLITIPTAVFSCNGIPVTRLQFTVAGTGTNLGLYLDDITLQGGLIPPSGSSAMTWRGTYSGTQAYAVNDVVFNTATGSAYVAIQASTGSAPQLFPLIWSVFETHGPAGVDGNMQVKAGTAFAAFNTSVSGNNIVFPGNISYAGQLISTNTTDNSFWDFITGSTGDSTCPAPLAGHNYFCNKSGVVNISTNGAAYSPIGTGSGSVTSIATTTPIAGGPITTTGTISCPTCAIGPGSSTTNHLAKFSGTDGVTLADGGAIPTGTVTSIATTSPITGGTITGTGTIACATCVTSAAALTANQLVIGGGLQATSALGSLGTTTTVLHGNAGGAPSFAAITTADLPTAIKTRVCEVVIGDPGSASPVLANDNDTPVVCANVTGSDVTVTAVACYADAGTPTVTPILTGGGGTSILTGALTCGTASWAAGTINGTPTIHSFSANGATCSSTPCTLDANITSAGGTAKYIVMHFTIAQ
jgi:hypothetical protein